MARFLKKVILTLLLVSLSPSAVADEPVKFGLGVGYQLCTITEEASREWCQIQIPPVTSVELVLEPEPSGTRLSGKLSRQVSLGEFSLVYMLTVQKFLATQKYFIFVNAAVLRGGDLVDMSYIGSVETAAPQELDTVSFMGAYYSIDAKNRFTPALRLSSAR